MKTTTGRSNYYVVDGQGDIVDVISARGNRRAKAQAVGKAQELGEGHAVIRSMQAPASIVPVSGERVYPPPS